MKRFILASTLFVLLVGCAASTVLQVANIDTATGYFPTNHKAEIVKKEKFNIDAMKALILVPNSVYVEGMIRNMKYFDKVINFDDLSSIIVQKGLQEKVPTLNAYDKISINKAHIHYKPFLWLRYNIRQDGEFRWMQLILANPKNLEDIFITEVYLGSTRVQPYLTDQNAYYPMYNALLDYVRENSKTYK